jgi:polysaccharide deacetylase 2 family uncharacterized protein YibQ
LSLVALAIYLFVAPLALSWFSAEGQDGPVPTTSLIGSLTKPDEGVGAATSTQGEPLPIPQWRRYARDFSDPLQRPRVAVIVVDLGLSSAATRAAFERMPPEVALSFNPYGDKTRDWMAQARRAGHEVLLDLPMEPTSPVEGDPGPRALRTQFGSQQNLDSLAWILGRGEEAIGLVASMGSRFLASPSDIGPILDEVASRGLIFVDNGRGGKRKLQGPADQGQSPLVFSEAPIDDKLASAQAIEARLVRVEQVAMARGAAIVIARPFPVSLERLEAWIAALEGKGLVLAPVSAAARSLDAEDQTAERTAPE